MLNDYDQKKLGTMLKEMREKLGLSQVALAKKLQCGQACISIWERGERKMTIDSFRRFVKFMKSNGIKVKMEELI